MAGAGFYGRGPIGDGAGTEDEVEVRRRLREVLLRQPEDRALLLRVARVLGAEKVQVRERMDEQVRAVLEGLGDQLEG